MAKALMKAMAGAEEQKEASKEANDLIVRLNSEDEQASMEAFAEELRESKL